MKDNINKYFLSLCDFYNENGINVNPIPKLQICEDKNNLNDLKIKTAEYDIRNKIIRVYVNNRHLKDIMRSISHELYHHHQNLMDDKLMLSIEGMNIENPITLNIESQAYSMGNLMFRKWCDSGKYLKRGLNK